MSTYSCMYTYVYALSQAANNPTWFLSHRASAVVVVVSFTTTTTTMTTTTATTTTEFLNEYVTRCTARGRLWGSRSRCGHRGGVVLHVSLLNGPIKAHPLLALPLWCPRYLHLTSTLNISPYISFSLSLSRSLSVSLSLSYDHSFMTAIHHEH